MYQTARTQLIYWFFMGLLILTLAISALSMTLTNKQLPLFETSSAQVDAVLACEGGGGSNNESGIC